MKKRMIPVEKMDCGHCKAKLTLHYYRESQNGDLYYCHLCKGLTLWKGKLRYLVGGKAHELSK